MLHQLIIAPSILSADFSRLQKEVNSIAPYADWIQVDVMDGHFVTNLSFGAPVMKWIKTDLPLDVHLMVTNPAHRIDEFVDAGASHITFHTEAVPELDDQLKLIEEIRSKGCTAGIALNPVTPLSSLASLFSLAPLPNSTKTKGGTPIDLLLLMTVNPGYGGQGFIDAILPKITEARKAHPDLMIQVDGGINAETAKQCREAGANNLVAGSYIFKSDDRKMAIESLRA